MKNAILLLVLISLFINFNSASAQQVLFKNQAKDAVIQNSSRMSGNEYVPGELIVKFKDNLTVKSMGTKFKSASTSTDALQTKYNVQKAEALFPGAVRLKSAQMLTAPNGQQFLRPSLHNIYKLKIAHEKQLMNAIRDFKADTANVVYAEPNYIVSINDDKPISPILNETDVQKMQVTKTSFKVGGGAIVDDPLYNQQYYIQTINADKVWLQTMGDTTQVIAIIDTGVDWLHPDLKTKIWKNPNPSLVAGYDQIKDDIRGWDFVNNDNNPMDDNSHGTHVAGLAAAATNNGIGIAGICPNAKIMPIKVFPSSGSGDLVTIIKGINYAATHGATVINMSFGGYGRSNAMEDALANAYATCILVAGAGNDASSIYDINEIGIPLIFYPAGFSFVFGVQSDGAYSNYDPDGPVYSTIVGGMNYELKAPGTAISTVLNGFYRVMSGTSMATPLVSGAVALYRSIYPNKSIEELWSDFIHSSNSNGILDLNKVFFNTAKTPQLDMVNFELKDTIVGDDNDGKADAGETVDIILQLRNTGAPADAVYAKIKQIDGDPKDISILKDSVSFGSIGIYRTKFNYSEPFKLKINNNCFNNRTITLEVSMSNGSRDTIFSQKLNFKIFNGEEMSGILLRDTTFTPDKNWVITNSLRIAQGVTLTILPGTNVEIDAGVDNRGKVVAVGTPENRIFIKGYISGNALYKYVDMDLNRGEINSSDLILDNCNITNGSGLKLKKMSYSHISNISGGYYGTDIQCDSIYRCYIDNVNTNGSLRVNLIECVLNNFIIYSYWSNILSSKNSVFQKMINGYVFAYPSQPDIYNRYPAFLLNFQNNPNRYLKNSYLDNGFLSYFIKTDGSDDMVSLTNQYWGTNKKEKIRGKYYDFINSAGLPYFNYEPKLSAPSDSCPGHVWKVLVNGKDAQDEFVEPVGIGKQRFDVYFNREMDKSITPKVSFGGLFPYTSNTINEEGIWSNDGRIYTVFKTIKLTTGDGINRIRVAGAKQAGDWGWEVPVEDTRFTFLISASSSASADFMATAGLGKVKMEWNNNDLVDALGFNMYRMENINDSTLTKPILINQTLITDTLYTDFNVIPNKKYYYFYKVLRTNLVETDSSKVVSAIPLTASRGDANGDLDKVTVLDIITIVSYLLGQNPQPFIFEAADVNGDNVVNVLDVVAVANIIKGNKSSPVDEGKNYNPKLAYINLKPEIIQLKSDAQVQAIQFELQGVDLEKIKLSPILKGFELAYSIDSNKIIGILYNLNGQTIPAGITDVIKIEEGEGKLTWGNVFGADPQGRYVTIMKKEDVSLITQSSPFGLSVQPNPSGSDMQISFRLPVTANVSVKVYNLLGELVSDLLENTLTAGSAQLFWNGTNSNGEKVKPGVYFIRVDVKDEKNKTMKEQLKVVRL